MFDFIIVQILDEGLCLRHGESFYYRKIPLKWEDEAHTNQKNTPPTGTAGGDESPENYPM
jgi:hypothetical protein